MNNNNEDQKTKKFLGCVAALAMTLHTSAQVAWDTDGNSVTVNEWFGADAGSTLPLRIETRANQPIEWYTDAVRRMVLSPTQSPTINGFTVPTDGFLGLSGHTNFFIGDGPFSRLHLADNSNAAIINAQQFAFRPWQRNGVTFTGNADHGYLGQEHNGNDTTDMVLLWSNDFGVDQFAPDHLSIRFLGRYGAATTGANSMRGLEAMRFFAVDPDRVNVGIGDYIAGAILDPQVSEPIEILDVLDGRVRIRALPIAAGEADGTYKVMVVDDTPSPSGERGVVKWVDPNDLPGGSSGGGADCDWDITPSANRITTAWRPFGTNGNCPEEDWKLG